MIEGLETKIEARRPMRTAGFSVGLLALGALAAFGTAGWARHGERLFLAMADGAWINCF